MEETETPSSLYKFYGASRIDVLENLSVCFSSTQQLNDALEGIPPIINAIGGAELNWISDHYSQTNLEERIIEKFTDRYILEGKSPRIARKLAWKLSRSKEARSLLKELKTQLPTAAAGLINFAIDSGVIDDVSENTGIFSMTECIDSGPMWAHYGQGFEGFALRFNLDHPFFRSKKNNGFLPKQVVYESRCIDGLSNARESDFFLTKSEHWSYEKEWRIFHNRDEADFTTPSGHSLFKIEPSVIDGVIIGSKIKKPDRLRIEALAEENSWGLAIANPNRALAKIEVSPIVR